jgi:hypothetical protein
MASRVRKRGGSGILKGLVDLGPPGVDLGALKAAAGRGSEDAHLKTLHVVAEVARGVLDRVLLAAVRRA